MIFLGIPLAYWSYIFAIIAGIAAIIQVILSAHRVQKVQVVSE